MSTYLQKELHPRPGSSFPFDSALHFPDARAASCGITTVFSALSFSNNQEKERSMEDSLHLARQLGAMRDNLLVKHFVHVAGLTSLNRHP